MGELRELGPQGDTKVIWDAEEEDSLPAVVRIVIEPAKPDGPLWYHEVPIFVGVYNEITGEDDFTDS